MRCVFLFVAGTLLGFLAETEKELRAEIAITNRLLSLARVGNRFSVVLQSVLTEFGRLFQGSAVVEVVAQSSTGRAFRWELASLDQPSIHPVEISPAEKASDLMSGYPHSFYMERNGSQNSFSVTALDEEGRRLDAAADQGSVDACAGRRISAGGESRDGTGLDRAFCFAESAHGTTTGTGSCGSPRT